MFNLLDSNTNQRPFKKLLYNQSNHYKNTDNFHCKKMPSSATTKSALFAVSKDEWHTLINP